MGTKPDEDTFNDGRSSRKCYLRTNKRNSKPGAEWKNEISICGSKHWVYYNK